MPSILDILTHAPLWVYAVFALLIVLGWRQSRTRVVDPSWIAAVALAMIGLSLFGVFGSFGAGWLTGLSWGIGFAFAGFAVSTWLKPRPLRRIDPDGKAVEVGGSWLPLAVMLGIFGIKFALGVATALHASSLHDPQVQAAASLLLGLASGSFAARARTIWSAGRPAGAGRAPGGHAADGGAVEDAGRTWARKA